MAAQPESRCHSMFSYSLCFYVMVAALLAVRARGQCADFNGKFYPSFGDDDFQAREDEAGRSSVWCGDQRHEFGTENRTWYFRFPAVPLHVNHSVIDAALEFTADTSFPFATGDLDLEVALVPLANSTSCVVPGVEDTDILSQFRVQWENVPAWLPSDPDDPRTPSLAGAFQKFLNAGHWTCTDSLCGGASLILRVKTLGNSTTQRSAFSFEGATDSLARPRLLLDVRCPGSTTASTGMASPSTASVLTAATAGVSNFSSTSAGQSTVAVGPTTSFSQQSSSIGANSTLAEASVVLIIVVAFCCLLCVIFAAVALALFRRHHNANRHTKAETVSSEDEGSEAFSLDDRQSAILSDGEGPPNSAVYQNLDNLERERQKPKPGPYHNLEPAQIEAKRESTKGAYHNLPKQEKSVSASSVYRSYVPAVGQIGDAANADSEATSSASSTAESWSSSD